VQSRRKNELENQINESGPAEVGIWSYHQKLVPKTNIQCQQSISALEMNLKYYLSQPVQAYPFEFWEKYKDLAPKITEISVLVSSWNFCAFGETGYFHFQYFKGEQNQSNANTL
jgi:hypothetical protein